MCRSRLVAVCVLMGLVTQPIIAAERVELSFGGKGYAVEVLAGLSKVCTGGSLFVVSPSDMTVEKMPLDLVKKGTVIGDATLVGKGEPFPFDVELKGATVSSATVRSNGRWVMKVTWASCANVANRKQ
jgi:hypothetical protein